MIMMTIDNNKVNDDRLPDFSAIFQKVKTT